MALNGDVLGLAMKAAVDAVADKTDRDALFKAMGNAIVNYITTNATVAVVTPGVTAGPTALAGTGVIS